MGDIKIFIIYDWFIYLFIFIICFFYLNKKKQIYNKKITYVVFVLIVVYALFYNADFDYYRLKDEFLYRNNIVRLEPIYYEIAKVCFGSYHMFRIIIWSLALAFFYKSTQILKLNSTIALVLVGTLYIMAFSYARASLAVSCSLFCYTLFLNEYKSKRKFILMVLIFFLSVNFHKTMIYLWLVIFVAHFIKPVKNNIVKAILAFPFISIGSNILIQIFIPLIGYISLNSKGYADDIMAGDNIKGFTFFYIVTLLPIVVPFIVSLFKIVDDRCAPKSIAKITMLAFFIIYVSLLFLTVDFGYVNLLCKRFLYLSIPFALISITYAYAQYAYCKKLIKYCVLMQGVQLLYYTIHVYNTIDVRNSVIF